MSADLATLTGPITGGTHGRPFSLPTGGIADDHVVEEFFLEGAARGYDIEPGTEQGIDGKWSVRETRTAPFRTRLLVIRPASAQDFNGTVAVNWQNVTAGFEIGSADPQLLGEGCAWVGVTAQRVGLVGLPGTERFALQQWDAERYSALEHPGDDFSFDIFTQAARAVGPDRDQHGLDPMGGLPVVRLLGAGGSQSAMRLRTYINAIQPVERLFDGFLALVDFGWAHPLDTTNVGMIASGVAGIPAVIAARIRDDIEVPVFVFNTETEAPSHYAVRQPPNDHYRIWELAGASHTGGITGLMSQFEQLTRDGVELQVGGAGGNGPSLGSLSDVNLVSYAPAYKAAVRHLLSWLTTGNPPPAQPLLEMEPGSPPTIVRDALGNARGGVRLPEVAVPLAAHRGDRQADVLLSLLGTTTPFTADQLASLYPSRDAYVKAYSDAVDEALAAGVVLEEDAETLKKSATALATALPE